jgi:hypothetical protein
MSAGRRCASSLTPTHGAAQSGIASWLRHIRYFLTVTTWYYYRFHFNFTLEETIDSAQSVIRLLIEDIMEHANAGGQGQPSTHRCPSKSRKQTFGLGSGDSQTITANSVVARGTTPRSSPLELDLHRLSNLLCCASSDDKVAAGFLLICGDDLPQWTDAVNDRRAGRIGHK